MYPFERIVEKNYIRFIHTQYLQLAIPIICAISTVTVGMFKECKANDTVTHEELTLITVKLLKLGHCKCSEYGTVWFTMQ